ncbi:homoserine dehydrogenase [Methylopila musalis]|uniref:Homoserine dehydrogenase n=1 Tax=Methylopila musalis TaxID=1134781 RepID=A0ABW3Z2A9_9HYPH
MRVTTVAIAGFGSVGRAAAGLLLARRERFRLLYGTEVRLVAVCGSRSGLFDAGGLEGDRLETLEPGLSGPGVLLASGPDLLIEAGPTDYRDGEPSLSYLRAGLSAGCDAVVISKGALARHGRELRALAAASNARLKVSGAAAAALPALDLLQHSLLGSTVTRLEGVLNATTNFLLDAMMTRGIGFDAALKEAQAGGFAEADPRNDTEGWDTAAKLLILATFGLGLDLDLDDIDVTGVQVVTADHIAAWRAEGRVPKLIGSLGFGDDGPRAEVAVRALPLDDPLARVGGKTKAVRVTTDAMGETLAIGGGREPLATAAAALKDVEHILKERAAA